MRSQYKYKPLKYIFFFFLFPTFILFGQTPVEEKWNVAIGAMVSNPKSLLGMDNSFFDIILNVKAEHQITAKGNIGFSYYHLLRYPGYEERNFFILSLYSKQYVYKKKLNLFIEPHLGYGSIVETGTYRLVYIPHQYYLGMGVGASYPIFSHFALSFSVNGFYNLINNPNCFWHVRPFLTINHFW